MSDSLIQWLHQRSRAPGVLACGLRFPDKTTASCSYSPSFPTECLDRTWRYVGDMFEVASLHGFAHQRARWLYERAGLNCVLRPDRVFFGAFIGLDLKPEEAEVVAELFAEFQRL
jgi:hypothetical protein